MVVQKNLLFQKLFSQTGLLPAHIRFSPSDKYCHTFCINYFIFNNLMINLLKKFLNRWLFETLQLAKRNEFKRLYRMATIVMASFMTFLIFKDFRFWIHSTRRRYHWHKDLLVGFHHNHSHRMIRTFHILNFFSLL